MKARIKKTGEIINVVDYTKIILEARDNYGDFLEMSPEDVELIQEKPTEDEHWQEVRERAAIAALQGTITILSNSDRTAFRDIVVDGYRGEKRTYPNEIAEFAVCCADALIEQLKKG